MSEFTPFVHSSQVKVRINIKYLLLEVEGREAQVNSSAETSFYVVCDRSDPCVTSVFSNFFFQEPERSQKGD